LLFNSFEFGLFILPVLAAFLFVPANRRWLLLLAASLAFYATWNAYYLGILFAVSLVAFVSGPLIERSEGRRRKAWLALAVTLLLSPLALFKYSDFILDTGQSLLQLSGVGVELGAASLLAPLGISFFTFQLVSYCIDIYRGEFSPERSFLRLTLYPLYFPHLIAGPIVRAGALLPQFANIRRPPREKAVSGLRLFLWGLFKKVVVADRLAILADAAFDSPGAVTGVTAALAAYFFAFQIYLDFSGYTDMARGVSRLMGIELSENFRRPYLSASFGEFWSRWHITLSTWFRDYLYIPLGGNRVSAGRWAVNILAVFALSGLWHGSAWTFVTWGLFHGLAVLAERPVARAAGFLGVTRALPGPALRGLRVGIVFHVTVAGWVLFRSTSFEGAIDLFQAIFTRFNPGDVSEVSEIIGSFELALGVVGVLVIMGAELATELRGRSFFVSFPRPVRWSLYYAAFYLVALFPGSELSRKFIYFDF
jgi:D-alanyl-lipoteichoic acid acyltransferase DltB (MBOAT superfamily)